MERTWALAPLEFIVRVLGGLMVLVVLLVVPATVFGSGSFLGVGSTSVCVETSISAWGSNVEGSLDPLLLPERGVGVTGTAVRLCEERPTRSQRVLSLVQQGSGFVYAAGLLLILWLLIRSARRRGFFVPRIALGVGRLGLYVLLGGVTAALLDAWATSRLADAMLDGIDPGIIANVHGLAPPLLAGFGLLTLGRILLHAVPMQRELDTTV